MPHAIRKDRGLPIQSRLVRVKINAGVDDAEALLPRQVAAAVPISGDDLCIDFPCRTL